jgi:predicted HTH transcriptional regulator
VYRAQELGTNNHEVAFNILGKQGAKTAVELSELLGINQVQTLQIIRELLQSGKIQQDITQRPPRFFVSH